MKLSVVSTLYMSGEHLHEFHSRIRNSAEAITQNYEIILVNDGSPDNSLEIALNFHREDPRTRVVDLSRNFGHHRAIMTGLNFASGEYVFLIDCDLEEAPELLAEFYGKITSQSTLDVVYGVQEKRKGSLIERLGGALFYRTFNLVANLRLPANPLTVRIMTRRYVQALLQHTEQELFMAGLFEATGFDQQHIIVKKGAKNSTSYSLIKRLRLMVTGITSFSSFPLLIAFYLGNLVSFLALLAAAYLFIRKLINPELIIEGWTSLMISVWFLGGAILISCGLIGLYLSKVYYEVKGRPRFIIKRLYGLSGPLGEREKE